MWAQSAAEVGKIVVAARRHRKLTQSELARAIGATQTWVSEVERGKETAQIGKVLRGAPALVGTTMFLRWMLRFASRSARRLIAPA